MMVSTARRSATFAAATRCHDRRSGAQVMAQQRKGTPQAPSPYPAWFPSIWHEGASFRSHGPIADARLLQHRFACGVLSEPDGGMIFSQATLDYPFAQVVAAHFVKFPDVAHVPEIVRVDVVGRVDLRDPTAADPSATTKPVHGN